MARSYAGILGLLAFLTCLARGLIQGSGPIALLAMACLLLFVFAATGCVIGWIAQRTVEEAVRGRVEAEVAADQGGTAARPVIAETTRS